MENKQVLEYYTPLINELFVEYEIELQNIENAQWGKYVIKDTDSFQDFYEYIANDAARVSYLTKEDIVSEGWIYNGKDKFYSDCENFQFNTIDETGAYLNYFMFVDFKRNDIVIEEMGSEPIYNGSCKSINEFRKLMLWLNIK